MFPAKSPKSAHNNEGNRKGCSRGGGRGDAKLLLTSVRDPVERFVSEYRYGYSDIGQPGKPSQLRLGERYPNINAFVSELLSHENRELKKEIEHMAAFSTMVEYLPLEWTKGHMKNIRFLCVADNSQAEHSTPITAPLHDQLSALLGINVEPFSLLNPSTTEDAKRPVGYDQLSLESIQELKSGRLYDDFALYKLAGCDGSRSLRTAVG